MSRSEENFCFLVVFALVIYSCLQTNNPTKKSKLIFSDSNLLKVYDLKTRTTSTLTEVSSEITSLEIADEVIYWTESGSTIIKSSSIFCPVNFESSLRPQAIAFSNKTKTYYIVDKLAGIVCSINKKSELRELILDNIEKPQDLAIDVYQGVMFILLDFKSILRAKLDGSDKLIIVHGNKITAFTLDREEKKILWSDEEYGITSANYQGRDRITLTNPILNVKSLAYVENQLFWLLPGALESCELANDKCKAHRLEPVKIDNPLVIKSYGFEEDKLEIRWMNLMGTSAKVCYPNL